MKRFHWVSGAFLIALITSSDVRGESVAQEVSVPAGSYLPFFAPKAESRKSNEEATWKPVKVPSFWMDRFPVTNGDFLEFVRANARWRKSRVQPLFSDRNYLSHWRGDLRIGVSDPKSPVTRVSWFAAEAYCEWRGKSLPTVDQWEYAAVDKQNGAEANREKILEWYSNPTPARLPRIGTASKNALGIRDLYGLVWEWTLDFNSLMQGEESRDSGTKDGDMFCGVGSKGALDPTDYASFMRYSFRNSLKANYTIANLGFRCVKE